MKHIPKIAVTAILYFFLARVLAGFMFPSLDEKVAVKQMGLDQQGNVYLARKSADALWVIKMGAGGEREVFRCLGWQEENREQVLSLTCDGNTLYALQSWYQEERQILCVSEVREDHGLKEILKKEVGKDIDLCDFQVDKKRIYITGIDCRTEEIFLFSDKQEEERELRIQDKIPVTACMTKSGVTALTQDRELYCFENGDAKKSNLDNMVSLKPGGRGMFLQSFGERDIRYYDQKGHLIFVCPQEGYVRDVQMDDQRGNLAVLSNDGEKDKLLFYSGDKETAVYTDDGRISTGEICRELALPFVKFTLAYVLLAGMILFLMGKVKRKKRLQYQMLLVLAFVSFFWVLFTILKFWDTQTGRAVDERMFNADTCNDVQKERLLKVFDPKTFLMGEYLGSSAQSLVEEVLSNEDTLAAFNQLFVHTEVFVREEGEYYVIFSEERAFGANMACTYRKAALDQTCGFCEEAYENGEGIEFLLEWNGVEYAAAMTPLEGREGMYILTKFPTSDLAGEVRKMMYPVVLFGAGGWLLLVFIFFIYFRFKWRFLSVLVTQTDKISKGDFQMPGKNIPDNEFGVLWASLGRLCSVMQIEDYKKKGTLHYMYQFAPKSFEEMFCREYLHEVAVGESVEISATAGILSLVDRETLFEEKWEENYVFYVNRLLEELYRQESAGKGIFFQDDGTLESLKVLFPGRDGAMNAVSLGIVCMEELTAKTKDCCWKNPFLLLHTSRYLCGLAGGSSQVYPFVASPELEILSDFCENLKKSGVRMAVTQETVGKIPAGVQVRHIGAVASRDEKFRFTLYEVLDVCPRAVKEAKSRTKMKFAQSLALFYREEFYQARSGFLEVLKECREDGIARWYVFACEEALSGGSTKHTLFSTGRN